MKFIKNSYAQAEGGVLIGIVIVVFIVAIIIWQWDLILQIISRIHSATCVNDPRAPFNKC